MAHILVDVMTLRVYIIDVRIVCVRNVSVNHWRTQVTSTNRRSAPLRHTMRRSTQVLVLAVGLMLVSAGTAQAATTTYKNGNANAQTWYSHSGTKTIKGGYQSLTTNDFVYRVRVETTKVLPGYPGAVPVYGATSTITVVLSHGASTSSWSRCKWWFNPDPSTPGTLTTLCTYTT